VILLKKMLLECGISQRSDFCKRIGKSHKLVNNLLNHGRRPSRWEDFVREITRVIYEDPAMAGWMANNTLTIEDLWQDWDGPVGVKPSGQGRKVSAAMKKTNRDKADAFHKGDPLATETHKEAVMITPKALKHFRMFRSPFVNEIGDVRDIFFSEDHIFLREMMLDTARNRGFTAVFGEVGSGKSVMRKAVAQQLAADGIRVVYPVIIDKSRITPASMIDALIMDISEESPRRSLEAKTRQALKLLKNRAAGGLKQVLVIEEAHLLTRPAIKALKQIYELEDGFTRLIGIILIGQPELKYLLDEAATPEIREVARRVTMAEISGIDHIGGYIAHKFERSGKKALDIFDAEAFEAMQTRLSDRDGQGRKINRAYPLTVNNLAARAMNLAADMAEERVTADVVMNV
jgi:type II secretory pathway predicted ATPase ExeA